jgi:hypothetical protein
MSGLMRWEFRDPLEVAMRREAMSCQGCRFLVSVVVLGERRQVCEKHRRGVQRCREFEEKRP